MDQGERWKWWKTLFESGKWTKFWLASHLYVLETRPDVGARHVHDVIFIPLSIESLNTKY